MAELPEHPNLVLIITDQERPAMWWPEGFAEARMASRARLERHGVSFANATCNTAMCARSCPPRAHPLHPRDALEVRALLSRRGELPERI